MSAARGPGNVQDKLPARPQPPVDGKPGAGYALFVAHGTYRQRRMIDAAGLLPVLGALLFAMPLLWMGAGSGPEPAAPARTSHVMIYLFAVWAGLVILSAFITRGLKTGGAVPEDDDTPPHNSTSQDGAVRDG